MIKWENITELSLTERLSDDMFTGAIVNQGMIPVAIPFTLKGFPFHAQATERIVKLVTVASSAVCGPHKRDSFK